MLERITGFPLGTYEQSLIEYAGYCFQSGSNIAAACSPGVQVSLDGSLTGGFIVTCFDFLPIQQSQLSANAPLDIGLVYDQGFSLSCFCIAKAVDDVAPLYSAPSTIAVQGPLINAAGQVYFRIRRAVNGTFVQSSGFSFKILATVLPERVLPNNGVSL